MACSVCDDGKLVTWLQDDGTLLEHQDCPRCVLGEW